MLNAPPLIGSVDVFNCNYIHMAMEDGSLGFAHVDNSTLYLKVQRRGIGKKLGLQMLDVCRFLESTASANVSAIDSDMAL